ncbi:MAG TPA: dihydroneopterin aldolase [Chitinophagaceae bacterium]|nr:dihydroneopterin aldolase [Chitinophagaceae bacterium]
MARGQITISLNYLRFWAFHGVYEDERKVGNDYEVNLEVSFPARRKITRLHETADYSRLHAIVSQEMQQPRQLLETFLMELVEVIHREFPALRRIDASIRKLHPPIPGIVGNVAVRYTKQY